jgi:dinuclear metal center YbgI/SA1388 family protein
MTNMVLKDFLKEIELYAPLAVQETYDNSGLQIGDPYMEIHAALVCIDVTPEVIAEAIKRDCNLVLCHHPLLFKGLKKISGVSSIDQVIIQSVKNDIAIVAIHTNLDNIVNGVNYKLADALGLKDIKILDPRAGLLKKLVTFCPGDHAEAVRSAIFEAGAGKIGEYDCCSYNSEGMGSFRAGDKANPYVGKAAELHFEPEVRIETIFPAWLQNRVISALKKAHPYEEVAYDVYPLDNAYDQVGSGVTGEFEEPVSESDLMNHVKKVLKVPFLKHSPKTGQMIKKVALCGGSGSFLLSKARESGAQAFITADVKFHEFFEPWPQLLLIDAGHYETEQFTKELLYEVVNKKISKFAVFISEVSTNPVSYF